QSEINVLQDRVDSIESGSSLGNFTQLSDTPAGYHPGKLVGYNLAGTALIPVDSIDSFTSMKDTPNSLSGHGTKVVTVKSDESGLEFSPYPNVSSMETRLDRTEKYANDINSGTAYINRRSIGGKPLVVTTTIPQDRVGLYTNIILKTTAVSESTLPVIISRDEEVTTNAQMFEGSEMTIVNQGEFDMVIRNVPSQGFYYMGEFVTWDWTISPNMKLYLTASILDDGRRAWIITEVADADMNSALTNGHMPGNINLVGSSLIKKATAVWRAESALTDMIINTGTGIRNTELPEIVEKTSRRIEAGQCRSGRTYYFVNRSTSAMGLLPFSGQDFEINGNTETVSQTIPSGYTEMWKADHNGTKGTWYFISRTSNTRG
ncbi:MAG: hypothetical protein ACRC9Y_16180, partial [Aeromonas veronii]